MGLVDTIREAVAAVEPDADGGTAPVGAYWCDDCGVRDPVEGDVPDEAPACPDCGDAMRFERSPDSGDCAC